jgi:hypothetical protein
MVCSQKSQELGSITPKRPLEHLLACLRLLGTACGFLEPGVGCDPLANWSDVSRLIDCSREFGFPPGDRGMRLFEPGCE